MAEHAKLKKPSTSEGRPLGEKSRVSTMVLTTFQQHSKVENVTSNSKYFFPTQNDMLNYLPK
jgi:hypothetical protein